MKPLLLLFLCVGPLWGQSLPGTQALQAEPDFSASMVAGIDRFALRLTEQSKTNRHPTREKLAAILGVVDERRPFTSLELVGTIDSPSLLAETDTARILRVRWPVLDGIHGEGLLIRPKGKPVARVI